MTSSTSRRAADAALDIDAEPSAAAGDWLTVHPADRHPEADLDRTVQLNAQQAAEIERLGPEATLEQPEPDDPDLTAIAQLPASAAPAGYEAEPEAEADHRPEIG